MSEEDYYSAREQMIREWIDREILLPKTEEEIQKLVKSVPYYIDDVFMAKRYAYNLN
jgi:hypothetical protein